MEALFLLAHLGLQRDYGHGRTGNLPARGRGEGERRKRQEHRHHLPGGEQHRDHGHLDHPRRGDGGGGGRACSAGLLQLGRQGQYPADHLQLQRGNGRFVAGVASNRRALARGIYRGDLRAELDEDRKQHLRRSGEPKAGGRYRPLHRAFGPVWLHDGGAARGRAGFGTEVPQYGSQQSSRAAGSSSLHQ